MGWNQEFRSEHIERHGIGRLIGTTKLKNSFIHSNLEHNTKGVFTSSFRIT
jgi:hypothetical protein